MSPLFFGFSRLHDWVCPRNFTLSNGLNKGEARNALARALFFHRHGEIRDRTFENQRYRASVLNLTIAAIVLWNTIYLGHAVAELRAEGETLPDKLLVHIAHTSASMATTSGHPNRSSGGFGRCEIRAPPFSMPLSVQIWNRFCDDPIWDKEQREQ